MKKNERNAGRKLKFGEQTETLQIKVPKSRAKYLKEIFYQLLEPYTVKK